MHSAKLIWSTPDAERLIAYLARVSNPKNQDNEETAPRLIRYLIKHKHWSPFEMADMCLEIETTRGIAAQILRHRSFTFQEFSQRYADVSQIAKNIPVPKLRRQDTKNRQNSIDDVSPEILSHYGNVIADHFEHSLSLYEEMISSGIAKESARFVLPLATPTRLYMHGSLRSWIHYIDLRSANGTQEEHRDIALGCKRIFTEQFPDVASACWEEGRETQDPKNAKINELEAEIATLQAILRQRNSPQ
jgi:thymidylate synthase (FAD)